LHVVRPALLLFLILTCTLVYLHELFHRSLGSGVSRPCLLGEHFTRVNYQFSSTDFRTVAMPCVRIKKPKLLYRKVGHTKQYYPQVCMINNIQMIVNSIWGPIYLHKLVISFWTPLLFSSIQCSNSSVIIFSSSTIDQKIVCLHSV